MIFALETINHAALRVADVYENAPAALLVARRRFSQEVAVEKLAGLRDELTNGCGVVKLGPHDEFGPSDDCRVALVNAGQKADLELAATHLFGEDDRLAAHTQQVRDLLEPKARIVLFEPDEEVRESIRDQLDEQGCTVLSFDDLVKAASVHCESAVDVLICSVSGRDDLDLLYTARSRAIPVIALTQGDSLSIASSYGIEFVIDKPFKRWELSKQLAESLRLRARYRQREEAKLAFGEAVVCAIDAEIGDGPDDGEDYADLLDAATEAFPHTSLNELVAAMLSGIREAPTESRR